MLTADVAVTPIAYLETVERLADLTLGYRGEVIEFSWRPYVKRHPEQQADYDRLLASIRVHGIQRPLITFGRSVLIGMRRAEIGLALGIETARCWRITEDVQQWRGRDLTRLDALKARCGAMAY